MPIAKWFCPACRCDVPLDHFATTACGDVVHPDYAAAIIGDREGQHVKGAVRVTHGLGCPRRAVIEHVEDYSINPLDANAALTGVAWHAMMERYGDERGTEVSLTGTLVGVAVSGKSDRIRATAAGTVIEDHKHIADANLAYIKRDGAKPEHVAQLSIYAELAFQQAHRKRIGTLGADDESGTNDVRITEGRIWYHTSKSGEDAFYPVKVALMPIDEALAMQPYGGDYTVAELYRQADEGFRTLDWRALPLAGASQTFGKSSACNWCSVRAICTEAERGAPF